MMSMKLENCQSMPAISVQCAYRSPRLCIDRMQHKTSVAEFNDTGRSSTRMRQKAQISCSAVLTDRAEADHSFRTDTVRGIR